MSKKHASPSSTGPAGPNFEVKVGATYLLAMLKDAEARGLPGATIEGVALQGAPDGYSLDDVVVHGRMADGMPATLEIQVKREITFSPKDKLFKEVVAQIAAAIAKPAFTNEVYELAVATGIVTGVITGSYQELLSRARSHASSSSFFRHLETKGLYSDDMRTFVKTLRENLQAVGAPNDEETTWRVLRRLQILYFDFIGPGSGDEANARSRCADVLHAEARGDAADLWDALIVRTGAIAADGGDATAASITQHFKGRFQFQGDDRYHVVRASVAEASTMALSDVSTSVLGISLPRTKRIDAVRAAIATGLRFIDIRGEAGVGKSALMKRFALEVARESRVLALAPGRIAPGGGDAFKARLGFGGDIEGFMRDLASDGGGWLFIDNLDFYTGAERKTVNDLIRAAAAVPGFTVIATARTRFGLDEPSWLDGDALAALGRAKPIHVGPIDDEELEQLRGAEPRLRALLAPDHPASAVTRNLYLLSRLLSLPEGETVPRTESEMASSWWKAAGAANDAMARVRGRALRDLGARAVAGDVTFDVATLDAAAIDALVAADALSDFGNDRVAFRHDVLREWAIAHVLFADAAKAGDLPLTTLGSPAQLRGVQLAARMALEIDRDPVKWRPLLDAVSITGAHGGWRRACLLALIHSEVPKQSIALMGQALLADDAALLRELIPIMIAVEMRPAREYVRPGVDPTIIPESLRIPDGPAWLYLVTWLLTLGATMPAKAVPAVVELFISWCALGLLYPEEPLTALILARFKTWLFEIEVAGDWDDWRTRNERKEAFDGAVDGEQLKRIEGDMRLYFSMLAVRVPADAKEYLAHVQTLKRKDDVYRALMKTRGTLAMAAPDALAAVTLDYLRKPDAEDDDDGFVRGRRSVDGALAYADKDFMPAAPAQGPFYELLKAAPAVGLRLIRSLIDGVMAYHTEGKAAPEHDVLLLDMPGGVRRFPWINTFMWSDHSHYYSVTSALMALETWAHERVESGDDVAAVIADIIGEDNAPAAYALVALHIILSHWPRSAAAGVPFAGCPELLSLDLQRPIRTAASGIDLFGLGRLTKEPAMGPRLDALTKRVSRRVSVDALLARYALLTGADQERAALKQVLERARDRLGAHQPEDDRGDPRLMAYLALNVLDRANWVEEPSDEEGQKLYRYVPPAEEVAHFEPHQAKVLASNNDLAHTNAINRLIDDPTDASSQTAEVLGAWAESKASGNAEIPEAIDQAIVGAAMILMRDGTPELRASKRAWAETQFARALSGKPDVGRRMRSGLLYNPVAMAFAGRVFALRDATVMRADYDRLLRMIPADAAAARGAGPAAAAMDAIDARLRPAILRVAFTSAVSFWHPYDAPADAKREADDAQKQVVERAISGELDWLTGNGAEPSWPAFEDGGIRRPARRRGVRVGVPREPEPTPSARDVSRRFVDHQTAALWLAALSSRAEADKAWMGTIEVCYASWTYAANGAGLPEDQDVPDTPDEWNAAFFMVMTTNFVGKTFAEMEAALRPLFDLPDDQFFGLTEDVLYKIDALYFNEARIDSDTAVALRRLFADRLAKSYGYQRLRTSKSSGIEIHLGPAVATIFFNNHGFGQPPQLYLPAGFIERSVPFVPVLQSLAEHAPCLFVAICVMNWVEAQPTTEHLPLVVGFAAAAMAARPDDKAFWSDHGMGARICNWLAQQVEADVAALTSASPHRAAIDILLAKLVAMGIAEARRLEVRLQAIG